MTCTQGISSHRRIRPPPPLPQGFPCRQSPSPAVAPSEQIKHALPYGWTYAESPDGRFIHIKNNNGKYRIRIDPPDKVTKYPHMHILDREGNTLDIDGNIVSPNAPDGHIPR